MNFLLGKFVSRTQEKRYSEKLVKTCLWEGRQTKNKKI
jgi:hypothetical protein